ncbi:MAG: DUF2393 domain-containing protein [Helicobacteraceae bacterium]|nr:DUF2393 domain-containing protein [Helicobacteraceae bacterium]
MLERFLTELEKLSANPSIARAIAFCDELLYSLNAWHLAVFGGVFALAIFFLIAAALSNARTALSLLFQMCAFAVLLIGPVAGYFFVERLFKPTAIENLTIAPLVYQENRSIVFGEAINIGEYPLKECRLKIKGYEPPTGKLDYLYKLARPQTIGETAATFTIAPNERRRFEVELNDAPYDQNLSLSITLRCR